MCVLIYQANTGFRIQILLWIEVYETKLKGIYTTYLNLYWSLNFTFKANARYFQVILRLYYPHNYFEYPRSLSNSLSRLIRSLLYLSVWIPFCRQSSDGTCLRRRCPRSDSWNTWHICTCHRTLPMTTKSPDWVYEVLVPHLCNTQSTTLHKDKQKALQNTTKFTSLLVTALFTF